MTGPQQWLCAFAMSLENSFSVCGFYLCVIDILFLHISEGELIVRLLMELTLDSKLSNISVIYPLLKNRYFL